MNTQITANPTNIFKLTAKNNKITSTINTKIVNNSPRSAYQGNHGETTHDIREKPEWSIATSNRFYLLQCETEKCQSPIYSNKAAFIEKVSMVLQVVISPGHYLTGKFA